MVASPVNRFESLSNEMVSHWFSTYNYKPQLPNRVQFVDVKSNRGRRYLNLVGFEAMTDPATNTIWVHLGHHHQFANSEQLR